MNRERISKAIDDISDEFKIEALDLYSQDSSNKQVDRKPIVFKKRFTSIAAAACLVLAFGITAYATGFFEMSKRTANPGETISVDYEIESGTDSPNSNVTIDYDNISRVFTFSGPESCNEIEFKASNVSDEYHFFEGFGDPDGWNDFLQGVKSTGSFNIEVYYSSQFGPDGCLFLEDIITDESEESEGNYQIIRLSGIDKHDEDFHTYSVHDECPTYYYLKYNTEKGYLIVVSGSESLEECERISSGLEIRETGRTIDYIENDQHDYYLCQGVG